jgi:hypothetical protein
MKTRQIDSRLKAQRALELCRNGRAYVVRTFFSDGRTSTLTVVPASRTSEMRISPKLEPLFTGFLESHGNEDGLFPGCSQTFGGGHGQ